MLTSKMYWCWKSNNIGSILLRARKRRPSILISCPDNVTKENYMLAVIEKKLLDHHETIAVLLRHISLENTEALYV